MPTQLQGALAAHIALASACWYSTDHALPLLHTGIDQAKGPPSLRPLKEHQDGYRPTNNLSQVTKPIIVTSASNTGSTLAHTLYGYDLR